MEKPLTGPDGTHVIVTWFQPAGVVALRYRGIDESQAADLRRRLSYSRKGQSCERQSGDRSSFSMLEGDGLPNIPGEIRTLTTAAGLGGFRFHDLQHQAITEMPEAGASGATIMAGHIDRAMMEDYSHV